MNFRKPLLLVCTIFLLVISISSMVLVGSVWATPIDVSADISKITGTNRFSLGFSFQNGAYDWRTWRDRESLRLLSEDANFKLIRLFTHDTNIKPCTQWDDATKTGTFNWANLDSTIQRIYEVSAQPLIVIGYCSWGGFKLPYGMKINPATGCPYPDSYAAYCREFVKHFKSVGFPVIYYEIINEVVMYYVFPKWVWYESRANYFLSLFNNCYDAMHAQNPDVKLGISESLYRKFLDWWVSHGGKLDVFMFHKYDADTLSWTDAQVLDRAQKKYFSPMGYFYGVPEARNMWFNARGAKLLAISSESNWAAGSSSGTDPRIQKVVGAVWTALLLRGCIISGVDYSTYFSFGNSKSWEIAHKSTGGYGFGMVNFDDNKPWYPYYVQKMIGTNLAVEDQIVETTSSSTDIRTLAWIHRDRLNLLLINKVNALRYAQLSGLQGSFSYFRIDNSVSYQYPRVQTGSVTATTTLSLNGYTVMLLQTDVSSQTARNEIELSTLDLNGDGEINTLDLAIIQAAFGTHPDDPQWNPIANVNNDAVVDIGDLIIVARYCGSSS